MGEPARAPAVTPQQAYRDDLGRALGNLRKSADNARGNISNLAKGMEIRPSSVTDAAVQNWVQENAGTFRAWLPQAEAVIGGSTLPAVERHRITTEVLRDLAHRAVRDQQHYRNELRSPKSVDRKRDVVVRMLAEALFREMLRRLQRYSRSAATEGEDEPPNEPEEAAERTSCNFPCKKDGHPCQHTVWEGWICWQHGGGRWDGQPATPGHATATT